MKDIQATGEASALKSTLQNIKFLNFFLFFWVIFALLDTDPDSEYRLARTLTICKRTSRVRQNSPKFKTCVFLPVPKSPIQIGFVGIKTQEPNISCLSPFKSKTWTPRRPDQNSASIEKSPSATTTPKTTFVNIDIPKSWFGIVAEKQGSNGR
jgi:hypothetical protein